MTVSTEGNAAFVSPSTTVSGATNVVFTFTRRAIAPAAAGVLVLQSTCKQYTWTAGTETDITAAGCDPLVQGDNECPIEYDLAAISDGVAYFGDRSHPLCSEATRPTMLAQWGVVKQP